MTEKQAKQAQDPERPGKQDGETDAAYDQRVRMEAEAQGVSPEEYKSKLSQETGTV